MGDGLDGTEDVYTIDFIHFPEKKRSQKCEFYATYILDHLLNSQTFSVNLNKYCMTYGSHLKPKLQNALLLDVRRNGYICCRQVAQQQ